MTPTTRPPAVAGLFYPADPAALRRAVTDHLARAPLPVAPPPKAIIVPHAGYPYSGDVAATAYRTLEPLRGRVKRIILLGPSHRVPFHGLALPDGDSLATPLGDLPVDGEALTTLAGLEQVTVLDAAHAQEHSLEVQLPFIRQVLGPVAVVPLVVGEADAETVAEVLERLWGGPETAIVVSSDLSHFHDYATAEARDTATARAIETLDPAAIGLDDACGRNPIQGLLTVARRRGLHASILARCNSGDTAGTRDRVVGYLAAAFHEPAAQSSREAA